MHVDVLTLVNAKVFHFGVRNFLATTEFVKSRRNFLHDLKIKYDFPKILDVNKILL